jgi:hypothetical protein
MNKIEQLLDECWLARMPSSLDEESMKDLLVYFKEYLEKSLSALSGSDQLILMSTYLTVIGYDYQELSVQEKKINLRYKLPGPIFVDGSAFLDPEIEASLSKKESGINEKCFHIRFDFVSPELTSKPQGNILTLHLNDCVRLLTLVLSLRAYREFEKSIGTKIGLKKWFFEYFTSEWSASVDELNHIENAWNLHMEWKIESHTSVS